MPSPDGKFLDKEGDVFVREQVYSNGDWEGYWENRQDRRRTRLKKSFVQHMIADTETQVNMRVEEAIEALATAIGLYRMDELMGLEGDDDHLIRLLTALDRMNRAYSGEDYIDRLEELKKRHPDKFFWDPPPDECLPH